jgi:chaperonin GroES
MSEPRIKPAPGRIAVEVINNIEERMRKINLYLPPSGVGAKPTVGKVIAVCDPYTKDGEEWEAIFPLGVHVVFGQYSGTQIQVGREQVIVLRETDILATIEDGAPQEVEVKDHE